MNTSKIIKGVVSNGRYTVTAPIVKEDYGLQLQIEGVDLPSSYQVDFSNSENSGTSITMVGNSNKVRIPTELIETGKDIFAFLYVVGSGYGRTVYKFRIPNKLRPDRTNIAPTPEEQSVIDQAISALNEAVAQTAEDVNTTAENASRAYDYAEEADSSATDARNYANNAQTSANSASASASQASTSASASAQSASQSAQIKADVESLAEDAQGYADSARQSASQASASEQGCARAVLDAASAAAIARARAEEASGYAQTASTKASEASQSATTASAKATESAQSANNAQTYANTADSAKTSAQTAQGIAESARDEAVAANTSAQQSETAMRELLEEYSDVATEATAQEILRREEDGLVLMEFALRALDNRLDMMVEDLPHDTTGQQLAEALNFGNSMLNALYNELANEEV